ncbi:hypothetical protein K458DRAFT_291584, partial [Lentithecium fluviatile CBS 122367]
AVSYTWGDGEATLSVLLNNRSFSVKPNLWACLDHFTDDATKTSRAGRSTNSSAWTHIWVDSICIDQGNDTEKSDQVKRVDQTYSDAACVSIWLGDIPFSTWKAAIGEVLEQPY